MRTYAPKKMLGIVAVAALALGLGGCAGFGKSRDGAAQSDGAIAGSAAKPKRGSLFGGQTKSTGEAGIGVNAFLWRATLETLNFMPILDSDPFGGTYVTDWHATAEKPDERFKVQVYILDTRLRADGIAVQVFRQTQGPSGWVDATVDPDTAIQIENAILTRARQIRIAQLETR
jgi:Domain of unknown function (DUF3576)